MPHGLSGVVRKDEPMAARTPLPDEPTPCLHLLAFDRPTSLRRLLERINRLDFGVSVGRVWLHISIDRADKSSDDAQTIRRVNRSVEVAEAFEFVSGIKTTRLRSQPAGLARQWIDSWRPDLDRRDAHTACVILEDDTLPSRFAWQWTLSALRAYGLEADIASLAWQRPTLVAATNSSHGPLGHMPPMAAREQPFLYKLMSTWGFVALRSSWTKFLSWSTSAAATTNATPVRHDGALLQPERWFARKPPGSVWSVHFIRFMEAHGLYTLYLHLGGRRTLCANLREGGLNFQRSLGADFEPLDSGDSSRALYAFPPAAELLAFDWDAHACARCGAPGLTASTSGATVAATSASRREPTQQRPCYPALRLAPYGSNGGGQRSSSVVDAQGTRRSKTQAPAERARYAAQSPVAMPMDAGRTLVVLAPLVLLGLGRCTRRRPFWRCRGAVRLRA